MPRKKKLKFNREYAHARYQKKREVFRLAVFGVVVYTGIIMALIFILVLPYILGM